MSAGNYALIGVLATVGLLLTGGLVYFFIIFNGLVALKNDVKKAWADIDVILKQRYDELPNVIAAVKGYAQHEQTLFENITAARTRYLAAQDVHGKLAAEQLLGGAVGAVFAVAENYPDLKANQNFLQLQSRVTGLEIEIADRRELYNAAVNAFNTRIESIPDVLIARMLRMRPQELFSAAPAETTQPDVGELLDQ